MIYLGKEFVIGWNLDLHHSGRMIFSAGPSFPAFWYFYSKMFTWLARFILRNRLTLMSVIALLTVFMAYEATTIQLSYDFATILPESDPDFQA